MGQTGSKIGQGAREAVLEKKRGAAQVNRDKTQDNISSSLSKIAEAGNHGGGGQAGVLGTQHNNTP